MRIYGTIELTVSSPPQSFTEPFTLDQAKSFLNLPVRFPEETAEDQIITDMIIAARALAERGQGRDLVVKQYDYLMDYFPCEIELRTPLVSVDLVRYRDSEGGYTSLVADTEYIVDPARGLLIPAYGESWPSVTAWPSSAVLVRFTSGLSSSDVFWSGGHGHVILGGMQQLISAWFNGRLPFEPANMEIQEYPYGPTDLLSFGAVPRVR